MSPQNSEKSKKSKSKKFESAGGTVQKHLFVLAILRDEGPKMITKLARELKAHPNTVEGMVKRMYQARWLKKIKEGPYAGKYAYYLFNDLEWKIEKLIKEKYPDLIKSRTIPVGRTFLYTIARELKVTNDLDLKNALDKFVKKGGFVRIEE